MAIEHLCTVTVPVVHAVAQAVPPDLAVGTPALARPAAVAEGLEAFFPDLKEIVLVDIALSGS